MSKLQVKIMAVEGSEEELKECLHTFFDLGEGSIATLLLEIKNQALTYGSPDRIWRAAFGISDAYAPCGIPSAEIGCLCCHWRELREAEQEALVEWNL